jgi:UDP-N-acetylmuramate: L-alanyl-gamma-D-glutamyl-meso-diaminopimelate ligase
LVSSSNVPAYYFHSVEEIVSHLNESCITGDTIVIMSNGGFGGIHEQVLKVLQE